MMRFAVKKSLKVFGTHSDLHLQTSPISAIPHCCWNTCAKPTVSRTLPCWISGMPEQDGIRLAQSMKQYAPFCQIIFLSSYLSYATEVYETEHIYFILKSQLHQRIDPALHQALTALGDRSVQITAQKDGSTHVIALQDVLYLERNLRKTKVITQQGVFLTQESPETLISGSGHFARCHQSYWVNLKHVQAIGSNHFTMDSGSGIPISRTYLQEAQQRFLHELIHI